VIDTLRQVAQISFFGGNSFFSFSRGGRLFAGIAEHSPFPPSSLTPSSPQIDLWTSAGTFSPNASRVTFRVKDSFAGPRKQSILPVRRTFSSSQGLSALIFSSLPVLLRMHIFFSLPSKSSRKRPSPFCALARPPRNCSSFFSQGLYSKSLFSNLFLVFFSQRSPISLLPPSGRKVTVRVLEKSSPLIKYPPLFSLFSS